MQITIKSIGPVTDQTKGQRSWQERVVEYKGQQGDKSKTLRSFESQIWQDFKNFQTNDVVDIKVVKEGDYWQWKGAAKVEGQTSTNAQGQAGSVKAESKKGGDWETSEERAARQVYIVKQSSLANALTYFTLVGEKPGVNQVIEVAKQFENFVFGKETGTSDVAVAKRGPGRPAKTAPAGGDIE